MPPRAPGSARKKGEALTSGPHGAAREKGEGRAPTSGPYRAVRGGRGRARGLSAAERAAPLGRVRVVGEGRRVGPPRPKARGERGVELGQGFWGWARFGEGDINKRKTLLYFSEL